MNLTLTSGVIKNNIEIYIQKFKSFSDTVKITNGKIINIGVDFTIVPQDGINDAEALMDVITLLQRIFDASRTNFNDSIVISDVQSRIQSLRKVRAAPQLRMINKFGTDAGRSYSGTQLDFNANTFSGILKFPVDSVWELKYPNFDIIGRTADQSTANLQGVGVAGGGY